MLLGVFPAQRTAAWLLSHMGSHVVHQVEFVQEAFATFGALVGFDTCVHSSVPGEGGFAREVLPALGTREKGILLVCSLLVERWRGVSILAGVLCRVQSGKESAPVPFGALLHKKLILVFGLDIVIRWN